MKPTPTSGTPRSLASLQWSPGQHAEAAGVNRQRLMQGELGREVRDGLAGEVRETAPAHQVLSGRASVVERGDRLVVQREEVLLAGAASDARAVSRQSIRTGLCAVARQTS